MVKPYWLRRNLSYSKDFFRAKELLRKARLNTVCEEAACPNIAECWSRGEATFIILGKNCTRNCLFCNVTNNFASPVDTEEPQRIARAVRDLQLDYVTVTSVTRDDLSDGGAEQFIKTVEAIKNISPPTIVEILIPDINGVVCKASVIGHNIETVERLYSLVRPHADYGRSLRVLSALNGIVKSAIMLGLGEQGDEIILTLRDLKEAGVSIVHIGQYLRPSRNHYPVARYYTPQEFEAIGKVAVGMGFKAVSSGPLVRSSYQAKASYLTAKCFDITEVGHR